ncbi:DNA polymerase II [Vibrio ulleungensis]|uniref:DNA polymerase n=1 Tax=Vibrio ulleungensis TaxID=2807619 RepID=A0ABS2HN16_9VIBR|nr:DNA polymerase II [Vibrio ulleungensis]MBM7038449.1 DNA polymerase II [Vibrio ulleungensis]
MQITQRGFILSRQVITLNHRPHLSFWVSTDEGPQHIITGPQQSVLFVDASYHTTIVDHFGSRVETKPVSLKQFNDTPVIAVYSNTYNQFNELKQWLESQQIEAFEDDISLIDRFLMERFIQGAIEYQGECSDGVTVRNAQCKRCDFQPSLVMVSLDIECSQHGVLYSIGLDSPNDKRVIMVGEAEELKPESPVIEWVNDEKQLLLNLFAWFERFDPDIIIGWSVVNFDLRLLIKRADYHGLKLALGRQKSYVTFRQSAQGQQGFATIPGRCIIDGIDGLKSAAHHFPSWSLENVSQQMLGKGKIIHNPHDRMDEINRMFYHDKQALATYNLQDCVLVTQIFKHTQLLEYLIERAKLTGLSLDKSGGSVAAFTNLYLPRLHRAGYVAPNLDRDGWEASPGGYVMDSQPGLYDSVLVLDFKSLYPSIIRTFLIDPLGLIEGLKQEIGTQQDQAIEGFKGARFHRSRHFLPELIETLWKERDKAKRNNNAAFSQAIKIIMNSFYGVLGARGCRFFDARLASSITMRGHQIMKETRLEIEAMGYKVIYGDTDSIFVALGKKTPEDEADAIGQSMMHHINGWCKERIQSEHALDSCIELEFETHFKKFFMPTIRDSEMGSKKRYAGLLGKNNTIVFKGLESVRTDWTELAHEFQHTLYTMVFDDVNPSQYVRDITEQVTQGQWDSKLVYAKRLRRKLSDYQKNIPPQVRAARLADEKNHLLGRALQYQNRGQIRYVMTLNGPEPLEYLESPIDYQHYIDKQLLPIADAILPHIGLSFEQLNDQQLGLF